MSKYKIAGYFFFSSFALKSNDAKKIFPTTAQIMKLFYTPNIDSF